MTPHPNPPPQGGRAFFEASATGSMPPLFETQTVATITANLPDQNQLFISRPQPAPPWGGEPVAYRRATHVREVRFVQSAGFNQPTAPGEKPPARPCVAISSAPSAPTTQTRAITVALRRVDGRWGRTRTVVHARSGISRYHVTQRQIRIRSDARRRLSESRQYRRRQAARQRSTWRWRSESGAASYRTVPPVAAGAMRFATLNNDKMTFLPMDGRSMGGAFVSS
jgi:hypothetical protein